VKNPFLFLLNNDNDDDGKILLIRQLTTLRRIMRVKWQKHPVCCWRHFNKNEINFLHNPIFQVNMG